MTRLFVMQLGAGPATYLRGIRAERMATLLPSMNLTVQEVPRRVGRVNDSHASRAFRDHFGTTPAGYRAEKLGDDHLSFLAARMIQKQQTGFIDPDSE